MLAVLDTVRAELTDSPGDMFTGFGLKTTVSPVEAGAVVPVSDSCPCEQKLLTETVELVLAPATILAGLSGDTFKLKSGLTVTVRLVASARLPLVPEIVRV